MFETSQNAQSGIHREKTDSERLGSWQFNEPAFGLFRAEQSNEVNCQKEKTNDQADSVQA